MSIKNEKIINLTRLNQTHETEGYSDGDIEDRLLSLFKQQNPEVGSFLKKNPGWATTYHLSKSRENLLNWIDFKPGCKVLEVGAGCGALTGVLAEKCGKVTALELSAKRAEINANRHADKSNVEVVIGNLEDLHQRGDDQYDYVICIGVLEYAGRFIAGDNPFELFLQGLRKHTQKDGTLVLAIENKLGLKYWSGAKEDHVRRYMEGIEGYPLYDGVKTFGKIELKELLNAAGFKNTSFYYPFPDYKLPKTIYSDNYIPGVDTQNIPSSLFPTPNPDQARQQVSREQLTVRSIAKNGLYGDFANSFLVLASNASLDQETVFSNGGMSRKEEFRTLTRIKKKATGMIAIKSPISTESAPHLANMMTNQKKLAPSSNKLVILPAKKNGSDVEFPYAEGVSLETILIESLIASDQHKATSTIQNFSDLIDSMTQKTPTTEQIKQFSKIFNQQTGVLQKTCVYPGIIDVNLDNFIQQKNKIILFDYEWVFDFPLPKDFLLWRSLYYFFSRHSQIIRAITSPQNPSIELGPSLIIPKYLYELFPNLWKEGRVFASLEDSFQNYVSDNSIDTIQLYPEPKTINHELPDNLANNYEHIQNLYDQLRKDQKNTLQELELTRSELNTIRGSRAWRVAVKVRAGKAKISRKK